MPAVGWAPTSAPANPTSSAPDRSCARRSDSRSRRFEHRLGRSIRRRRSDGPSAGEFPDATRLRSSARGPRRWPRRRRRPTVRSGRRAAGRRRSRTAGRRRRVELKVKRIAVQSHEHRKIFHDGAGRQVGPLVVVSRNKLPECFHGNSRPPTPAPNTAATSRPEQTQSRPEQAKRSSGIATANGSHLTFRFSSRGSRRLGGGGGDLPNCASLVPAYDVAGRRIYQIPTRNIRIARRSSVGK